MKGTLAFCVVLGLLAVAGLMLAGGLTLHQTGMATVSTANGTYLLPADTAAAALAGDVAWQQEQSALAAQAERDSAERWQWFIIGIGGVVVLVGAGLLIAWYWPAIETRRVDARMYRRYLAGQGRAPAYLLAAGPTTPAAVDLMPTSAPAPPGEWPAEWLAWTGSRLESETTARVDQGM